MVVPQVTLNDSRSIPQLGFGVWRVPPAETERVVSDALAAGYRHIDTAALYENEAEVGAAIRRSGIAREDLFITTKLWNDRHRRDAALAAFGKSLELLGLDYADLYLIHWPCPKQGLAVQAWEALIEIQASGRALSIGVSNFREQDLAAVIQATGVTPAVNQIEYHPTFQQPALARYGEQRGIVTEVWRPLGLGQDLALPQVAKIAAAHRVTPAQAVIRWHLQQGFVVFPKTTSPARMAENLDVFGFELTPAEMAAMTALDTGSRLGMNPADS